jgi:hypothetical protein
VLTEQHHPQPEMCLRLIWPERQHPLIFGYRLSRMAGGGEHVRQVLVHLRFVGLLLRRFAQFNNCARQLIHQHQQPAQVMVRFSKISVGLNCLLKLELGFRVAVLLYQQIAKIVPGFGEVRLGAQGLTELTLAGRSVALLDGDDTLEIVRLRTLRIGLQGTAECSGGLRNFALPQIRVAKIAQ